MNKLVKALIKQSVLGNFYENNTHKLLIYIDCYTGCNVLLHAILEIDNTEIILS